MQSNRPRLFQPGDRIALGAALVLALCAAVLAIKAHEGTAALLLEFMAGMVLGFTRPHAAWRWALALASWIPIAAILQLPLPDQNSAQVWCPTNAFHTVTPAAVAGILFIFCFIAVYLGVAIDWLISVVLAFVPLTVDSWLRFAKPVLRAASIALFVAIVLYASLSLAQPLQPFGLRERYCWDEFCFSVQSVSRVRSLTYEGQRVTAHGVFYLVTAKMETPWWGRFGWSPDAVYVTDYAGVDYRYSDAGQRIADRIANRRPGCHQIPGASEVETVVFDLPESVVQPRLLVRDTLGVNGLLGGWRSSLFYVKPAFNLRYD